jgi:hypothetical protein
VRLAGETPAGQVVNLRIAAHDGRHLIAA